MDTTYIERKIALQEKPTILFSDIDGTLFSPNAAIITAPLYNIQTALYLTQNHIPFIVVTGRSFWRSIDQYHLTLLGLPKPDAVITANGTIIAVREKEKYVSDFTWQGIMQSTKITDAQGHSNSWNKWEISNIITDFLEKNNYPHVLGKGNTYLIRIRFNAYPVAQIEKIRKDILQLFPKGLRIILTEKLLWKNTKDIFSGEMLITPATAGKDKAIQYILKNLSLKLHKPIHSLIFGDASVDLPMLTMKEDERYYTLSQYGIHPTPLAHLTLKEKMKTNSHIKMLLGNGPREILWTLRPELRKQSNPSVIPAKAGIQSIPKRGEEIQTNVILETSKVKQSLSPAQNSKARKVIGAFEKVLDRIVDKNLSPNEISFLGLQHLSEGLQKLQKPHATITEKVRGLYQYGFGNLTDILDGIRARNSTMKEENGQLVDGFSDRAKEFMQLFHRAKKRMETDKEISLQTFLVAISCALPSIARAQVEISGKTVSERDEKGGSMIDRTKRLFLSLLFDSFNMPDQSLAKDLEIYKTNIATFHHRLTYSSNKARSSQYLQTIKLNELSDFQKKALERFLLYVDVLQQENTITTKYLSKHPTVLKAYTKEVTKLAKNYITIPVARLRKKWKIADYKLEIKKYL